MASGLDFGTKEAANHLRLVKANKGRASKASKTHLDEELSSAPLFSLLTCVVLNRQCSKDGDSDEEEQVYPQYGLLGLRLQDPPMTSSQDHLIYSNVSAPWSAFICGSQGSGKSHTLSCLLENSLISSSPANQLTSPLAGLVLHYDKFTAFSSTQLCEAAYLCSSKIPVRILVSPTNYRAMENAYTHLPALRGTSHLLKVEPLYLPQRDLNISMMKTLMGINNKREQPLYVEVVMKILREMAIANQGQNKFNYAAFKRRLLDETFVRGQEAPLRMRLEVLESFFEPGTVPGSTPKKTKHVQNGWEFGKGTLTIIDLSCPFVGPDDACALFNICISLFLKGREQAGRILALDEAHGFLTSTTPEAVDLTETLLSVVRQQRHLGTRVVIATQEPTVSPSLLDLCNVTVIHRFTSPAWFKALEARIAGATIDASGSKTAAASALFNRIVRLGTGEALLFCASAFLDTAKKVEVDQDGDSSTASTPSSDASLDDDQFDAEQHQVVQLGTGHIRIRIRQRVTADGGRSIIER